MEINRCSKRYHIAHGSMLQNLLLKACYKFVTEQEEIWNQACGTIGSRICCENENFQKLFYNSLNKVKKNSKHLYEIYISLHTNQILREKFTT